MAKEKYTLKWHMASGVIASIDKNSLSSRSRSGSRASHKSHHSSDSGHYKRRFRSSSSSSSESSSPSSGTSSRSRSRSHPRCHRRSPRCRCNSHIKYGRGRHLRSPPRRYRAQYRSYSRSPIPHSSHRRYRSRSGSPRSWSRHSGPTSRSLRSYGSQSRSDRAPECTVSVTLYDKKELLETDEDNPMKIPGVENLDRPERDEPVLSEQSESKWISPQPWTNVKQPPTNIFLQNNQEELDDTPSPELSPKGKISFSINNSVVKPTVVAPCAKVTPRVDSYDSRKPYGHWVPVKSGRTSNARPAKLMW